MSEILVNDHEKRLENEIKQLLVDIQRIQPQGEPHCAFGDLFTDPAVEQFYEALVGTLKSAKKRGLINFKGQILLKGMHDKVNVSIVDGSSCSGNNNNTTSLNDGSRKGAQEGVDVNVRSRRSGALNSRKLYGSNTQIVQNKFISPSRSNATNGVSNRTPPWKVKSYRSPSFGSRTDTSVNEPDNATNGNGNMLSTRDSEHEHVDNNGTTEDAHTPLRQITPTKPRITSVSSSNNKKVIISPMDFDSPPTSKLDSKLGRKNGSIYDRHRDGDEESLQSFATAPVRSSTLPAKTPQPKIDIMHSKTAGTTFGIHSNINSISDNETHVERVEREVNQLLVDIRRIEPEQDPYCNFGDLFVDEFVEQYYEALVGTLKAAKRKGLIKFKGQMLFKGMHDHVQIDIVE